MDIDCAAKREAILGEGPCWNPAEGRLYWVDIRGRSLEWLDPSDGAMGAWPLEFHVSALALRSKGGLLVASDAGLGIFRPATAGLDIRYHPEPERSWNRSNDGHTDTKGRFWFGTMDDNEQQRTGAVYRLDPDWTCTRVLDGLGIPNSLTCSPDGHRLYIADSKDSTLYAYDMNVDGTLGARQVIGKTSGNEGTPDGSAVDEEGFIWNAQWGGWRIVRYAPDGRVDRVVMMPVAQPTSCAFGGDDLATLFVTSARVGLSSVELEKQELAGSLFAFRPGVRGFPTAPFEG